MRSEAFFETPGKTPAEIEARAVRIGPDPAAWGWLAVERDFGNQKQPVMPAGVDYPGPANGEEQ